MSKKKATSKARATAKVVKTPAKRGPKAEAPKKARATAKASSAAPSTKANAALSKAISQKQSKSQIYAEIADMAQVSKQEAKSIIAAIRNLIERHVKPKGSGEFVLPDLGIKVRRVQKKATKARTGRNPFTGEEIQISAKPARKSVKVSALKTLKALIED